MGHLHEGKITMKELGPGVEEGGGHLLEGGLFLETYSTTTSTKLYE